MKGALFWVFMVVGCLICRLFDGWWRFEERKSGELLSLLSLSRSLWLKMVLSNRVSWVISNFRLKSRASYKKVGHLSWLTLTWWPIALLWSRPLITDSYVKIKYLSGNSDCLLGHVCDSPHPKRKSDQWSAGCEQTTWSSLSSLEVMITGGQ